MNQLLGSSSLSPWGGSRTAAVACTDSHHGWWGLALQKILVDVLGVPLQPSCIQQNIFTALLDSAFCRWSWVTLKEGLYKKHTTIHKGINRHRQDYIFKSPDSLDHIEMLLWIMFLVWLQFLLSALTNIIDPEKFAGCSLSLQDVVIPSTEWEQQNASISLLKESHSSFLWTSPNTASCPVLSLLPGTASGTWRDALSASLGGNKQAANQVCISGYLEEGTNRSLRPFC